MVKITYYYTLYKREITRIVAGDIAFKTTESNSYVIFHSGGHGYQIETKYIRKIEPLEMD